MRIISSSLLATAIFGLGACISLSTLPRPPPPPPGLTCDAGGAVMLLRLFPCRPPGPVAEAGLAFGIPVMSELVLGLDTGIAPFVVKVEVPLTFLWSLVARLGDC